MSHVVFLSYFRWSIKVVLVDVASYCSLECQAERIRTQLTLDDLQQWLRTTPAVARILRRKVFNNDRGGYIARPRKAPVLFSGNAAWVRPAPQGERDVATHVIRT